MWCRVRFKAGSQEEPSVPWWRVDASDAYTFDESTGLKAQQLDDAGLEARLDSAEPGYYRQPYDQEEWPDCKGTCFWGKCTIFAVQPGCCWAGPLRDARGPYAHARAANTDANTYGNGGDNSDGGNSVAESMSDMHRGVRGSFRDSLREAKPWLCWS